MLKNVTNRLKSLQVLILIKVMQLVKRVFIATMSIWKSKVDGNTQLNLTATKDIVKESVPLIERHFFKQNYLVIFWTHQFILKLIFS